MFRKRNGAVGQPTGTPSSGTSISMLQSGSGDSRI